MKLNKRMVRLALIAAITAAVSIPLLNQLHGTRAVAQTGPNLGPEATPVLTGFPMTDPKKVVLSIGDQKITAGEFNEFFTALDPGVQQRVLSSPQGKRQLADQYVDMKLLAGEAKHQKLDDTLAVRTEYEQILANQLMVTLAKEVEVNQKFFNDNKGYFSELQARHILIGVTGSPVPGAKLTDAEAAAKATSLKARLDKGEDFVAMARMESDDKQSAAEGGSLGMMSRGQMVPAFEETAFALKDKEISQPVKTQFGYHIIQVMSRTTPAYNAEMAQRVARRRLELLLEGLKKAQKPEVDDAYFGSAPASAKAPTTAPHDSPGRQIALIPENSRLTTRLSSSKFAEAQRLWRRPGGMT